MARQPATLHRRSREDDEAVDSLLDVPAAVLCAFCGQADCPGCSPADSIGSGVVAIVPWERPGGTLWSRLWATSNATTQGAEPFFSSLPDGDLFPALGFAMLAELLAVLSMLAFVLPVLAICMPSEALEVFRDPVTRTGVLRPVGLGVPAVASWMVLAHAVHGVALDVGARRRGARTQKRLALRFGLYACGWDLMMGPLGAIVLFTTKGRTAVVELVGLSPTVPAKSSLSLLQGTYGLREAEALRGCRMGTLAAVVIAVLSGLALVIAALLLLL